MSSVPHHFDPVRVLGQGAFGTVHLARERSSGALVAIKEFPAAARRSGAFFRELSKLFTARHPNIIQCLSLEYGQDSDNFLVFEYANGGTLRDHLNHHGPIPLPDTLDILREITAGLACLHHHGLIHRDLKPDNILLHRDSPDSPPVHKISDLGIATLASDTSSPVESNGSPAYMAPEQFYDRATYASDLYALGVILCELLTGHRPFIGGPQQLFSAHCNQPPDLSALPPDPALRNLATRLLAKKPEDRPASALDLLRSLDLLAGHTPASLPATPPPPSLSAAPAWSLPGLQLRTTPLRSLPAPGALSLHALDPWRLPHLYLSDNSSTDLLDLSTLRLQPAHLAEPLLALASEPADNPHELAISTRQFLLLPPAGPPAIPRPLFPHHIQPPPAALLRHAPSGHILVANHRRLHSYTSQGRPLWQRDNANYTHPPLLASLPDGPLLISSGPLNPSLRILDPLSGEPLDPSQPALPLPAPALALWPSVRHPGHLCCVAAPPDSSSPALLLLIAPGPPPSVVEQLPLPPGLHRARPAPPLLFLTYPDHLLVISESARTLLNIPTDGPLLDALPLPFSGHLALLETHRSQTRLRILNLHSA